MNFFRRSARPDSAARTTEYAPLSGQDGISDIDASTLADVEESRSPAVPFSWFEYGVFFYLGMAMLWSWCVTSSLFQEKQNANITIGTCF